MPKQDDALIQHMLSAIQDILDDVAGITYEDFLKDGKAARAVVFSLVTLGEASRQLSDETRKNYAHVPWRTIADTRNKLVHEYSAIDYPLVWEIVRQRLPELQKDLFQILKQIKTSP